MAVYDDQDTNLKTRADDDELRRITGVNKADEKAMEARAFDDAAADERASLRSDDAGWSTNLKSKPKQKGFRGWLRGHKKQVGIGGGIAGILVGGGFGLLTIVSGPAQIIQFAQFLDRIHFGRNENAQESRVGRMFEYFRATALGDQSLRNVGYTMEKISNRYRDGLLRDGIEIDFSDERKPRGQSRRMQGLMVSDPDSEVGRQAIDRLRAQGFEIDDGRVDLSREGTRRRRAALKSAVDIQGKGRVSSAISKRILIHRAGVDFHPLRNARRTAGERLLDWRLDRKRERADRIRDGNPNPNGNVVLEGRVETGSDGNINQNDTDANNRLAESGNTDGINEAKSRNGNPSSRKELASRLTRGLARAGGAALAAVGILCAVRNFGNGIDDFKHQYINLVLIRQAFDIVSASSQIKSGQDVSLDEIGALADDFYDKESGTSVWSAPAVLAAQNKYYSVTDGKAMYDVTVKPGSEKPELFNIVDGIPLLRTACRLQDGVFGFLQKVPVIGHGLRLAEGGAALALDVALKPFGLSRDEFMDKAIGVVAGDVVNLYAKGAELGGNAMIGALLTANDAAIASGGVLLDQVAVQELDERIAEEQRREFQNKSFTARMFDIYDPSSFVAKAMIQNPSFASAHNLLESVATLPSRFFSLISSGFSNLFTPRAAAATYDYDYGVGVYGWSNAILDNEEYADPYENAYVVEEEYGLGSLNDEYGDCFAMRINPSSFAINTEETPTYEQVNECSEHKGKEDFIRYRLYLLDTMVAKSLACYESIDTQACAELNINARSSASITAGALASQYIPDCGANNGNAQIACVAIDQLSGVPYDMPKRAEPTDPSPDFLDCSALTAMAVYRAFGVDLGGTISTNYPSYPEFEQIDDVRDAQPGDLVGRTGHIAVVVSYDRTTQKLITMEASSKSHPSGLRGVGGEHGYNVGFSVDGNGSYDWVVRYVGPKGAQ